MYLWNLTKLFSSLKELYTVIAATLCFGDIRGATLPK